MPLVNVGRQGLAGRCRLNPGPSESCGSVPPPSPEILSTQPGLETELGQTGDQVWAWKGSPSFLLPRHWSELGHMATPCCWGVWET